MVFCAQFCSEGMLDVVRWSLEFTNTLDRIVSRYRIHFWVNRCSGGFLTSAQFALHLCYLSTKPLSAQLKGDGGHSSIPVWLRQLSYFLLNFLLQIFLVFNSIDLGVILLMVLKLHGCAITALVLETGFH